MTVAPGIIQKNDRVWKAVLRDENDAVIWTCKHTHSKPQFNVRWSHGSTPWEASAANCADRAFYESEPRTGFHGKIADVSIHPSKRDDMKIISGTTYTYRGHITLTDTGHRILDVTRIDDLGFSGWIDIDNWDHADLSTVDQLPRAEREEWAMATWTLKGSIWGVVFRNPNDDAVFGSIDKSAVGEILYGDRTAKPVKTAEKEEQEPESLETDSSDTQPHIRVAIEEGKRIYEVVDWHDTVVGTYVHRGKAVNRLTKVRSRASG